MLQALADSLLLPYHNPKSDPISNIDEFGGCLVRSAGGRYRSRSAINGKEEESISAWH